MDFRDFDNNDAMSAKIGDGFFWRKAMSPNFGDAYFRQRAMSPFLRDGFFVIRLFGKTPRA